MCHTQGREGQYNFEEPIHTDGKVGEAGHGHINGILQEGATLWRKSFREGVSLDVAAITFNASHQTSRQHLYGEDP